MGHIHMAQRFELETGPAFYTGSPFRTDFGQLEPKSVLFAEFDGQRLVETREIETPCRGMVHIDASWEDGAFYTTAFGGLDPALGHIAHAISRGAEVRFRYAVAAEHRDAARVALPGYEDTIRSLGAFSVKSEEEVVATKRARAPEVARAVSIADKLDAHWASIGYDPTDEHREALHTRAQELEQEAANAT
jgi:hypothetical protein